MLHKFKASIEIIGINPFVFVPPAILENLFEQAGKSKGFIPVCGTLNKKAYKQTLVKFKGEWRLYINTTMLKNSPKRIGALIELTIAYDPVSRVIPMPAKFKDALEENAEAKKTFEGLSASRQNEIVRYIARLKHEETIDKNINRAVQFLLGKEKFVGRDKP